MADLSVRRAVPDDLPSIVDLLAASMGRDPALPYDALFRWKHLDNPFGPSPSWVALDGDRIAGFRTFLRWEFRRGDEMVRAVRAVDTATHPEYQGRGIFTQLTRRAVDDLRAEGVDLIFNTPNEKSRPGYLKMGWQQVGTLATHLRPTQLSGITKLRGRVPSEIWSEPTSRGVAATDAFADGPGVAALLAAQPISSGLHTNRTPAYLRWRFEFGPLHYRVVLAPEGIAAGCAVFRLRRRGRATEAVIAEVLAPNADTAARRRLAVRAARTAGADYALTLGKRGLSAGWLRMPTGPILTARSLTDAPVPAITGWDLTLGDVELF